jgi:hypothetical protein
MKWLRSYNFVDVTSCGNLQWNLKKRAIEKALYGLPNRIRMQLKKLARITGLLTAIAIAYSGE